MNRDTDNSSARAYFRALIALMCAAVPANALWYGLFWNSLPARIATHFGFNNQPNGWMSREGSLLFSLVLSATLAVVGSLILLRVKKPDFMAWGLLGLFCFMQWVFLYANYSIIGYNVEGRPVNVAPVAIIGACVAIAIILLVMLTHRGAELTGQAIFADETHASPVFAAVMGVPGVVFIALTSVVPVPALRIVFSVSTIAMILATAMAWGGFHYLFSSAGVEIRTLGFRLRSIPAAAIRSYAIDRWNVLGGYGIRGLGNRRAYIWGNRGVKITTDEGEVFLGHNEPEKIVRDLDLVTREKANKF